MQQTRIPSPPRLLHIVVWILCLVLIGQTLLAATSCQKPAADDPTTDPEPGKDFSMTITHETSVAIIYSAQAYPAEKTAAAKLAKQIYDRIGVMPDLRDDGNDRHAAETDLQILIGETKYPESVKGREELDELSYLIRVKDTQLIVLGSSPRITAFAVDRLLEDIFSPSEETEDQNAASLTVSGDCNIQGSYYEALRLGKIIRYNRSTNGCEDRPTQDIVPSLPSVDWKEGAYYTGESLRVSQEEGIYGGAQYVVKLFTEGLSRGPKSEEYLAFTKEIEQNGCTQETLKSLAVQLFSSTDFLQCSLSEREQTFAVYRAVLNRDPTMDECRQSGDISAPELARRLCDTEEFLALLPSIRKGPYFRGENATTFYTGNTVLTAEQLQLRLNREKTVQLAPGTIVLMDRQVTVPYGTTLRTAGCPEHYLKMARLIRTGDGNYDMLHLESNAVLEYVFVDGNADPAAERIAGTNVVCVGNGGSIRYCRCSDAGCTYTLNVLVGTEFNYIGHNLVTCYASDHNRTWTDGVRSMGAESLIEYNTIIDATDAALAVFRHITNIEKAPSAQTYIRAQDSIVRYNTIIQAGNSSYASLDFESNNINWNDVYQDGILLIIPENPANFTGFVMYENQIWTSLLAHTHLLITMSTQPWTKIGQTDRVFGGSVYNNYTPEGLSVCCGTAICADGNTDAAIRGNRFSLLIGDWCGETEPRIYSIDCTDSSGDFQPGYIDLPSSGKNSPYIVSGTPIETAPVLMLRRAYLYESPQSIPLERFSYK